LKRCDQRAIARNTTADHRLPIPGCAHRMRGLGHQHLDGRVLKSAREVGIIDRGPSLVML
jgi:hypothetical protein